MLTKRFQAPLSMGSAAEGPVCLRLIKEFRVRTIGVFRVSCYRRVLQLAAGRNLDWQITSPEGAPF